MVGIFLLAANTIFSGFSGKFFLKNASAFDIVYKRMPANEVVYYKGQEPTYEDNLIKAGEGILIQTKKYQLAIKRYGYGSGFSSWTDVPGPDELARQQLTPNQFDEYDLATTKGNLPIITIRSGYTGGWSFTIGHMK